jgi:starch-binding outer membrane protein, SusD/RagB family
MKNKFKIFIVAALLLTGASSCTNWLEVLPENQMILEQYWKTESDAQGVLSACYRGLIENDVTYRMLIWGEMRSDNVIKAANNDEYINKILGQEITPTNANCSWGAFYSVINNCNTFLRYAPDVVNEDANFTPAKLHAMEAEVLTIRALAYFYLVRAFKDVPFITTPSIDDSQNYLVAKSPEKVILDSITQDLLVAAQYAKTSFTTLNYTKGRITKNAVYALLADIYLWDQKYDECIGMCNKVMSDNTLKLVGAESVIKDVFYEGKSTETIFELQFNDKVQINYATRNLYGWSGNDKGGISFPTNLAPGKQYSPFKYSLGNGVYEGEKDTRAKDFFKTDATTGVYNIFKYAGLSRTENATSNISTYTYRSNTSNWIIYRLSDVILMKAEALLQKTGDTDFENVVALVNKTYKRSNPDADTLSAAKYSGFSDVESLVLRERQRELMFEGKRWFDLVRLARRANSTAPLISYVAKTTTGNEALGRMSVMNALYWPIHKDELNANTLLEQNPFYNTVTTSTSN